MTPVLVDSNVVLDVSENGSRWSEWSTAAIERFTKLSLLVINPIIYAEVSIGYRRVEEVEAALPLELYRRETLPFEAAFLAGKCYLTYRRRGGPRRFGAHAAVRGYRLLTRDVARYRSYFPTVELIAP